MRGTGPIDLNYGHEFILREASGYEGKLDTCIQHGVDFETERVYPGEAFSPVCTAWSWSELRDGAWAKYKPIIQGCAPFLYLLDSYTPPKKERKGTLYAPLHGTTGVVVEDPNYYYHLSRTLSDLPQPVTVSLYYQEANDREIVRQFEKRGMEVVCNVKSVNDVQSLKNQIDTLSGVEYFSTNDVGTGILYATAMGIPSFLHGKPPNWTYAVEPGMSEHFEPTKECRKEWAKAAEPFKEFSEHITAEQFAVADYHLGISRKMSKDVLKQAFEWAASLRWPA